MYSWKYVNNRWELYLNGGSVQKYIVQSGDGWMSNDGESQHDLEKLKTQTQLDHADWNASDIDYLNQLSDWDYYEHDVGEESP